MKEKGEVTFMATLLMAILMGLVLLCSLELKRSFRLLEKRTNLYLCTKEAKGELSQFMKFMGLTNWGIKNVHRASVLMMFIPGLQGASLKTQQTKKILQRAQDLKLLSFLKNLTSMKLRSCPLDPRLFTTPFEFGMGQFRRDAAGAAILRSKEWNYFFISRPYSLKISVQAQNWEALSPQIAYQSEEKAAKLFSPFSFY